VALIKSISGIRGTIGGFPGEGLTPVDVINFASAYGVWIKQQNKTSKVVVGRDARPSGIWISELTVHALRTLGIDVVEALAIRFGPGKLAQLADGPQQLPVGACDVDLRANEQQDEPQNHGDGDEVIHGVSRRPGARGSSLAHIGLRVRPIETQRPRRRGPSRGELPHGSTGLPIRSRSTRARHRATSNLKISNELLHLPPALHAPEPDVGGPTRELPVQDAITGRTAERRAAGAHRRGTALEE